MYMKTTIIMKRIKTSLLGLCGILAPLSWVGVGGGLLCSCSDFFEQESDRVIYADKDHLTNWPDTVSSVTGILNKLQVIADRTILFGEVRGDLVSLTSTANADLRELANFTVSDDNQYNQPRDYYAIINNCNYFIANVDTTLKNNRNQTVFLKEYGAVKAIRAWTYLQLVLNYGSVPFITEPILTKEESELNYPRYELADVCQYFLEDLANLPEACDREYPDYEKIRGNQSRLLFFPLNIVRGDLNLWLGSLQGPGAGKNYFEAAVKCYTKYISERNGINTYYPVGVDFCMWLPGGTTWNSFLSCLRLGESGFMMTSGSNSALMNLYSNESYYSANEIITMIAGDSIRAEGYYSELRNYFVSREENDNLVSITPSNRMVEISEDQVNVCIASNKRDGTYAPSDLTNHRKGDLRLSTFWREQEFTDYTLGTRITAQYIYKYPTRNVHVYRRQMLYLRLAEALNLLGQPRVAYKILERGLADDVLAEDVYPYLSQTDSAWVAGNLDMFPVTQYKVLKTEDLDAVTDFLKYNTMGIHSRGSGWTPKNEYYRLVGDTLSCYDMQEDSTFVFNSARYEQLKALQQQQVDSLILNENALECCFEGTRYYDLMRFALRSQNPGQFLTEHVNQRGGKGTSAGIDLTNRQNWYLRWKGQIGY